MTQNLIKGTMVYQTSELGALQSGYVLDAGDMDKNGKAMLPARCVVGVPPAALEGHWQVWTGTEWTHVEDHRGEIWYEGANQVQIIELGAQAIDSLTKEAPVEPPQPEAPVEPVDPLTIPLSRKQLRKILLVEWQVGDTDIEAAIDQIQDATDKQLAMIDWQDSDEYNRSHELVASIATALGKDTAEIDRVWKLGVASPV
ncbi:MAG: hypothetical protein JKY49_06845 [Cohaesibacteraceae bacterium]|nr:hypothetical protein [Cohaesibacteraceae bacterium]MBL4876724.1 hypothetical protein [Cohaesibacteraceae bacterium]